MNNQLIVSNSFDPAYNLALEEYLIEEGKNTLYLWQNDNTIVIGRNQNPYKECNISKIREDNVHLVRRRSGGGAVFHDLGNLNFTIISKKKKNNIEENFDIVNEALSYLGINAIFNGRNDLEVQGKKISGNAFYEEEEIFCHHGTLLIDVDLSKLNNYLTVSKIKLESKGIDSVRSRVLNLSQIDKKITAESLKEALSRSFKKVYPFKEAKYITEDKIKNNCRIMNKVNKYKSWDWTYSESPNYNVAFEKKFDWGIIEVLLEVDSGVINKAKIYTDSIIVDNFDELSKSLLGNKFEKDNIILCIKEQLKNQEIINDLKIEIEKI